MDSDDELLRRCAADPDAFRELVGRFRPRIYSFLLHMAGREAAEDLLQDVWLRVFKHAPSYEPQGKAASWLFKIANNLALDHLARRARGGKPVGIDEVAGWLRDPEPGPHVASENNETRARLASAIKGLPVEQRQIFLLREFGGMPFKEIAESLDIPLGTALSRMNYALESSAALSRTTMHKEDCLLFESGEMSPGETARFERHLASCPECRDWLAAVQSAHRWAEILTEEPAPRQMKASSRHYSGWNIPRGRAALLSSGLVFAALGFVFLIWQRPRPSINEQAASDLGVRWDTDDLHSALLRAQDGIDALESSLGWVGDERES